MPRELTPTFTVRQVWGAAHVPVGPVSRAGLRDLLQGTEGLSDAGGQNREPPGN